ncbi:MAG TPA: glycosyltransferase [Microlunatus sp.]|nr:glycosyltransferase [Microlunatus sp.]
MKVAFLIPVFQSERTVAGCLASVLEQTFRDFEIVVVDDGSTDRSADIVAAIGRRDDRVRLIRNDVNRGVAASLNVGLSATDADLIARLDADDEADRTRLERQVELLGSAPDVVLCGSYVTYMGRTSTRDSVAQVPVSDAQIRRTLRDTGDSPFFHPSVIFRRSAVVAVGGYREFFANAEDYDLWLRLAPEGAFHNIPRPLTRYRLSTRGASLPRLREQYLYARLAKVAADVPERDLTQLWDELVTDLDESQMRAELTREHQQQASLLADLGHPLAAVTLLLRSRHQIDARATLQFIAQRMTRAVGGRLRALV